MDAKLIEQLDQWHKEYEHGRIMEAILEIPETERSYGLIVRLARAYNYLFRDEEALELLARVAEEGAADPLWHYHVGFANFSLNRYEKAAEAFGISNELEPDNEDTQKRLNLSLSQAERARRQEWKAAEGRERVLRRQAENPAAEPFADMDLTDFWNNDEYARKEHIDEPLTEELLASVEEELGYKLPASYIALMRTQNGGVPRSTLFPADEDIYAVCSIAGIGRNKPYSLCGELGSRFMIEEWGYPDIGVVICDCPSGGHDLVMLDYRLCGPEGEPQVIHVSQGGGFEITFLAEDFETFVRGLVDAEEFDNSKEEKQDALRKVAEGEFSPLLSQLVAGGAEVDRLEEKIRSVCTQIVREKGHFSFHADELSYLMYDVQFWLYTRAFPDTGSDQYLDVYKHIIVLGSEFGQSGYGPGFVSGWLNQRLEEGRIVQGPLGLRFTEAAAADLIERLNTAAGL